MRWRGAEVSMGELERLMVGERSWRSSTRNSMEPYLRDQKRSKTSRMRPAARRWWRYGGCSPGLKLSC